MRRHHWIVVALAAALAVVLALWARKPAGADTLAYRPIAMKYGSQ